MVAGKRGRDLKDDLFIGKKRSSCTTIIDKNQSLVTEIVQLPIEKLLPSSSLVLQLVSIDVRTSVAGRVCV